MDETNQGPGGSGTDVGPQEVHRYDSFVVRLWSRGDGTRFGRAELRHVQSDVVSTGTMVGLEWVDGEILRLLGLHEEP
jgi:hypothetical protein